MNPCPNTIITMGPVGPNIDYDIESDITKIVPLTGWSRTYNICPPLTLELDTAYSFITLNGNNELEIESTDDMLIGTHTVIIIAKVLGYKTETQSFTVTLRGFCSSVYIYPPSLSTF